MDTAYVRETPKISIKLTLNINQFDGIYLCDSYPMLAMVSSYFFLTISQNINCGIPLMLVFPEDTLLKTNKQFAPENRPSSAPEGKDRDGSSSHHPFSCAMAMSFRGVTSPNTATLKCDL